MRRAFLLLAVLFVVPLFGSDSPKEYDDKKEVGPLEGVWRLTEVELDGKREKCDREIVVTYRNGTFTYDDGDGRPLLQTYRIDLTHIPPHLDKIYTFGVANGLTTKCIYQLDGDTLKVANFPCRSDTQRPQSFNDDGAYVQTYKRVRK